jgi:membrane protease YdiL (CAAX protease family)
MMIGVNLAMFLLLHYVIGRYPEPLPASKDRRGEIFEVLGLWVIVTTAVTLSVLIIPESELQAPTFGIVLKSNLLLSPFWVVIPLVVVLLRNKWSLRDLGFTVPRSSPVTIFAISVMVAIGILQTLDRNFEPIPGWLLIMSVYQPAFTEEFLFRGVIQGKLERVLGQNKAWFYSGILFGLMHTSVNFFGQQWYRYGENYLNALILLLIQIIAGWTFGIIYMKSRSLLPGVVAHFLTDGRFASIMYYIASIIA